MAVRLVSLDAVKANLPIRAGNTEHDDRLRQLITVASRQIENATRRQFDKKARVELYNTRDAGDRVLNLFGTSDLGVETFQNMGTSVVVREQTITLKALPVDTSATIEVRYDPLRVFGTDTIVDPSAYSVDAENGRLFLRFGTRRTVQGLRVSYTGGTATQTSSFLLSTNSFDPNAKGVDVALSNNNLTATVTPAVKLGSVMCLTDNSAGKYYVEFTMGTEGGRIGVASAGFDTAQGVGQTADSWAFDTLDGQVYTNGVGAAYGEHVHAGGVLGMALDLDNDAVWFSNNGVWMNGATLAEIEAGTLTHAAFAGLLTGNKHISVGDASGSATFSTTANFGASPMEGQVPSGFVAGSGPLFVSPDVVLVDPPDDLLLATIIQTTFLWKKLDPENVGAKADKKQGGPNLDFLKAAGLTPEAASLVLPYKTIAKGYS